MARGRTDKTHRPKRPPGPGEAGAGAATRRIAWGTILRAVGEAVAKVASVLLYVVLARELGEAVFGDFIFGLSIAGVVLTMAAFGTDDLIAREVSKDPDRVHRLYGDTLALKVLLGAAGMLVIAAILVAGSYSTETTVAVMLLSLAVWIEVLTKTVQAVMQGHEQMQYIAASLIVQRGITALVGIVVLLAGGDLIDVSIVIVGGAVVGLAAAVFWLYRYVHRPRHDVDRSRWMSLVRAGIPLGLAGIVYAVMLKLDATLLSFLKGGDNTEVGQYGAAFRLIEATMFISWAFGGAVLPWFSRHAPGGWISLGRGYALGLKAMVAMLMPIAVVFGILAVPVIDLLYGAEFDGAVLPLQLLAVMTVLYGFNTYISVLMIARDQPGAFTRPAAIVLAQNVVFNFILIPPYGATGAAINAVLSGILLAVLTTRAAVRLVGPVSIARALLSSALAAVAMAAVLLLGGVSLNVAFLALAGIAYAVVFLAVERFAFPEDFHLYVDLLRRRRGGGEGPGQPGEPLAPAPGVTAPGGLEP